METLFIVNIVLGGTTVYIYIAVSHCERHTPMVHNQITDDSSIWEPGFTNRI